MGSSKNIYFILTILVVNALLASTKVVVPLPRRSRRSLPTTQPPPKPNFQRHLEPSPPIAHSPPSSPPPPPPYPSPFPSPTPRFRPPHLALPHPPTFIPSPPSPKHNKARPASPNPPTFIPSPP
ncbi:extensin-like [Amaranthus tricolor]|uniref:extensin-like n=1 Tax=Amaranthus tricolor TaxID=29722 RepID=UPI0025872162|nr:extensin-like [Amaranthus tricolor]